LLGYVSRYLVQHEATEIFIEPSQLRDIFSMRPLVAGLFHPSNCRLLPTSFRFDAEALRFPISNLQSVEIFLRLALVDSPRRLAYSLAVRCGESDPPDITAFV